MSDGPGDKGGDQGDKRPTLDALWRDHARAVFGFLAARVGRERAEDLTSEVFVRVAKALPTYRDQGVPVRAWLMTIARNLWIESSRRSPPTPEGLAFADLLPAPGPDPAEEVSRREELGRALALLRGLPPAQQEVIDLRYLRDLSVAETAAVLKSNEEAVRALTYRALKALRRAHGAAESGDPERT